MNRTILLVEDDENDVFLLTRALGKTGIASPLRVASDGQQALDYVEGKGKYGNREEFPFPYLILLDLKLPLVKGLDVLRRVRELTERPIVVVLSSSRNDMDITEAYRLGTNAYLSKPASFEGLVETVKAIGEFWLKFNVAHDPSDAAPGAGVRGEGEGV